MKRIVMLAVLTVVVLLTWVAAAPAATPLDVYSDYAEDRALDGPYTVEELEAYLDDAMIRQYEDDTVIDELDRLVMCIVGKMRSGMSYADALAACTGADTGDRDTFPFTGGGVTAALLGVAVLVGGATLRRSLRTG